MTRPQKIKRTEDFEEEIVGWEEELEVEEML